MAEFLTTTLAAAVKSLAVKGVTGPVESVAKKALERLDGQAIDEATAAVANAVEAARRDLVNDYFAGEDELSRDVVTLLRHPPFTEAVVRRLLFRGQPDFERLRPHYLDSEGGDGEAAGERWQRLHGPLAIFFETIEQHLGADPLLGPLLREGRMLAAVGRIEDHQRLIAEASRKIERYQARTAEASEAGGERLTGIEALAAEGNATLGRILEVLGGSIREYPRGPAPRT